MQHFRVVLQTSESDDHTPHPAGAAGEDSEECENAYSKCFPPKPPEQHGL